MHWFWRGVLAVVLGCGILSSLFIGATVPPGIASYTGSASSVLQYTLFDVLGLAMVATIASAASLGMYGILTHRYGPKVFTDGETRCRKCQYILKGISEPRCPECGERI